jgi:hypothetical protein
MRAFTHVVGTWHPSALTWVFNYRVRDVHEMRSYILPSSVKNDADVWHKVCTLLDTSQLATR